MRRSLFLLFVTLLSLHAGAQVDDAMRRRYEQFRKQAVQGYDDFRGKANREYAEFMQRAWQEHKVMPAVPRPKNEERPPVVISEDERRRPIESTPVTIDGITEPPVVGPQPRPVAPVETVPQPEERRVAFMFYGTECNVRFDDDCRFVVDGTGNEALAQAWLHLSGKGYDNLVCDCLDLRARMELCDWAYLNMLHAMAQASMGSANEATLLAAYIFCQSGYKMRIGRAGEKLYLLYASRHNIYGRPYFRVADENYYILNGDVASMDICDAAYPGEQPLSLLMDRSQMFANVGSELRTLQSERYPEMKVRVNVNRNLIDFYGSYPSSETDGNFMIRWAIYAGVPLERGAGSMLYTALRPCISGMAKKDAVERLLNFVQTAFVYEYDDKVWGFDRAFFPEETLYYPYCDCEDRSILFSRFVRDLLGLDVVLVYYPGHLATAVCFGEDVPGDYIMLSGRRFVVCDPTYIGAGVGMTMPDMDNQSAKVILLP